MDEEDQVVELIMRYQLLALLQLDHASARLHGLQGVRFARRDERLPRALKVKMPPRRNALGSREPLAPR